MVPAGFVLKLKKVWYSIYMTKLQSIISQIQELPALEREELNSLLGLNALTSNDIFELTDEELAELDRRMKNIDNEPTFTVEEVFSRLKV